MNAPTYEPLIIRFIHSKLLYSSLIIIHMEVSCTSKPEIISLVTAGPVRPVLIPLVGMEYERGYG